MIGDQPFAAGAGTSSYAFNRLLTRSNESSDVTEKHQNRVMRRALLAFLTAAPAGYQVLSVGQSHYRFTLPTNGRFLIQKVHCHLNSNLAGYLLFGRFSEFTFSNGNLHTRQLAPFDVEVILRYVFRWENVHANASRCSIVSPNPDCNKRVSLSLVRSSEYGFL